MAADRTWLRALPAYTKKSVDHEVGDKTLTFHPLSAEAAFSLRAVARPIARILAFLSSSDDKRDSGYVQKHFKDGKSGDESTVMETTPPTVEMAKYRVETREGSIDEFISGLMSDEIKGVLGLVIIDSLRPRDDEEPISAKEAVTFVRGLDLPTLLAYLKGVAAANAEVFSPLGEMGRQLKELAALKVKQMATSSPDALDRSGSPESPSTSSAASDAPPPQPTQPEPAAST